MAYWVWVTGPDYYEDAPGIDRADFDPGNGYVAEDWWTCHRDTKFGDLVVLYRSQKRKDIAYLIKVRSDAYSIGGHPEALSGWDWGCDYEILERFSSPLHISQMRDDPVLQSWGALRANFQRRAYGVPTHIWEGLLLRLRVEPQQIEEYSQRASGLIRTEYEIESELWSNPHRFNALGFNLQPVARQHWCSNGGRADMIFYDRRSRRNIVIELKRDLVGRNAIAQAVSYRASVLRDYPGHRKPMGVLIGHRIDNEAAGMIAEDDRLEFISLRQLGITEEVRAKPA